MFRYIGNKTKLLPHIEEFLGQRGVSSGVLCDIFAGTATVGAHFKAAGWGVVSNDFLTCSYVAQQARIGCCKQPDFKGVLGGNGRSKAEAFREVLDWLEALPGREGLITRAYSPAGHKDRMYFHPDNARRIDAILAEVEAWREEDRVNPDEFWLLLASLLKAADRVANISGTYGAYLKQWQPNATKPLRLDQVEVIETERPCQVHQEDANQLIPRIECDVLYIDPPYNHRQYAANYHVLEVIAEHHRVEDQEAYREQLYGKTGLRPYDHQRSRFNRRKHPSSRKIGPCEQAFRDLVLRSNARHVVVSYNEEGILSKEVIGQVLAEFMGRPGYPFEEHFRPISYKRFRSDADRSGKNGGPTRQYRRLPGRERDKLHEWLFYAARE